jgi:hypothetical protein
MTSCRKSATKLALKSKPNSTKQKQTHTVNISLCRVTQPATPWKWNGTGCNEARIANIY